LIEFFAASLFFLIIVAVPLTALVLAIIAYRRSRQVAGLLRRVQDLELTVRRIGRPAEEETETVAAEIVPTEVAASPEKIGPFGAGTHRREPAQFVQAGRAHARDLGDEAVGKHPHHDRAGMPAARDQAPIGGFLRRLGVDVERLRIVALRELDDLFLADRVFAELDDFPGLIILEPALLERYFAHGGS